MKPKVSYNGFKKSEIRLKKFRLLAGVSSLALTVAACNRDEPVAENAYELNHNEQEHNQIAANDVSYVDANDVADIDVNEQ
jgi:hypothetical protein